MSMKMTAFTFDFTPTIWSAELSIKQLKTLKEQAMKDECTLLL